MNIIEVIAEEEAVEEEVAEAPTKIANQSILLSKIEKKMMRETLTKKMRRKNNLLVENATIKRRI